MQKYKKTIVIAIIFSAFLIVYSCIFLINGNLQYSLYARILKDYTYCFCFSILLFMMLKNDIDEYLLIGKFKSFNEYTWYQIKEKFITYAIFFAIVTSIQTIFYMLIDPYFNFVTLIYRNIIFYFLINFVNYLIVLCRVKSKSKCTISLCLLWLFLIFAANIFPPTSMIRRIDIFVLIEKIDVFLIIRYSVIVLIIIVIKQFKVLNRKEFLKKWLD
ncbi:hypothetical protein [Anaerorhabdus sp.]|uniref:hypothetical protein n=1 Tax=Anaerorhabdus sp. TaxID=1872524 RepID=UPI002FCAA647